MQPSDKPLEMTVERTGQGVVVKLTGSATMDRCEDMNACFNEVAKEKPRLLVIDLSGLDFICSLGLGGIVAAYLRALKYDGTVVVSSPAPAVLEVLELTRLDALVPIYDSAKAALEGEV
jgi:anti-anti-sigma factor